MFLHIFNLLRKSGSVIWLKLSTLKIAEAMDAQCVVPGDGDQIDW
jgi:hypothetical protein